MWPPGRSRAATQTTSSSRPRAQLSSRRPGRPSCRRPERLSRARSRALGRGFLRTLDRALLGALGRRGPFFALFLLLFDHLDLARDGLRGRRGLGRFLFLRARRGNGDDRNMLVAEDLALRRGLDFAQVNGLADLEVADVHRDHAPANLWAGRAP